MTISPSSTSTGKSGGPSDGSKSAPRPGAGGLRARKTTTTTRARTATAGAAGSGTMWRFYNEDSPGLKVGPVPVLVMSLIFIASVFVLHIWGKFTRS